MANDKIFSFVVFNHENVANSAQITLSNWYWTYTFYM